MSDTIERQAPSSQAPSSMAKIPGGVFGMGSDRHYPEEAPSHLVEVDGFWMDRAPVTNREFRKFVNATGYVTFAEIAPDAKDYPGALPRMLKAGSLVFTPPKFAVDLSDWSQWWNFKFGANWRRPYGPRSSISGLDDHPVVHVAYRDAEAYAAWAGRHCRPKRNESLPRAAASTAPNTHGATSSRLAASTWPTPGRAGFHTKKADGWARTSPVGSFPANGYGL
jgi:sulfatase modifying factor 1